MSTSHTATSTIDKPVMQTNRPFRAEQVGSLLRARPRIITMPGSLLLLHIGLSLLCLY